MAADKKERGNATTSPDLAAISERIAQTQRDLARSLESIRHETSAPVLTAKAKRKAGQTMVELIFVEGTTVESLRTHSIMDGIKSVRPQVAIGVAAVAGLTVGLVVLNKMFDD